MYLETITDLLQMTEVELCEKFNIQDIEFGLSSDIAEQRLLKEGQNVIEQDQSRLKQYMHDLIQPQNLIMFVISAICLSYNYFEEYNEQIFNTGILLIIAIFTITTFEFRLLYIAKLKFQNLMKRFPFKARVIRDGLVIEIPEQQLVRGDIVLLKAGDKVLADMRILDSQDLAVDNQPLTGEVDIVEKHTNTRKLQNPLLSPNMIYSKTFIKRGEGKAIVIATGKKTIAYQSSLQQAKKQTDFEIQLKNLN